MPINLNCTDEQYATAKLCSGVLYGEAQTDGDDTQTLNGLYVLPFDMAVYFKAIIMAKRIAGDSPQDVTYAAILEAVYRARETNVEQLGSTTVTIIQQSTELLLNPIVPSVQNFDQNIIFFVTGQQERGFHWNGYIQYFTVLGNSA